MAEAPKIVRDRLRQQAAGWQAADEHPDANLLSAFAEHALAEQERVSVLDHLSRCAACRQIVALSLPEFEQDARAAAGPAPATAERSWWRSPVVHWSALTAAALVVLIAVGERMRLREGHSASAPAIAKYEPAQQSTEATAPPALPVPKESPKPAPAAPLAKASKRAEPMGAGSAGELTRAEKPAPSTGVPVEAAQNALAPPPPPTAELETNAARASKRPLAGVGTGAAGGVGAPGTAVGRIVGGAIAAPAAKSEAAQDRSALFAMRASLRARWSVSDAGALQRSFDAGRTWKEVAVAEGVHFRAVAVVASDVWAGGSGGALYHSADGGEHWSRVRVEANGRELGGDIVRIEFADIKNGVMTTSTGETWATSDGGATWQQQ